MESSSNNKKIGIGIAVAALAAVVAVTTLGSNRVEDTPAVVDSTTTPPTTTPVPPTKTPITTPTKVVSKTDYRNGTYTATGSYMSPGGMDKLVVTVTLKDDIITAATVTPKAGDKTSERYQAMFIDGYKPYVIGKDIDTVSLDKVSGSSLTPQGFNDALTQIEAQAKA